MVFISFFKDIPDPRIDRKKLHLLADIIGLVVIATICGVEGWEPIADFGRAKIDFLRTILELPHGIPSHDTIERVFQKMKPEAFENAFQGFAKHLGAKTQGKHISFDGKVLRGTRDESKGNPAINMVSAWVTENEMVFGQMKVESKTNEINALHQLISLLDLEGSMVTIDAIGCQKDITQEIVDAGADYIIGLKDNQKTLFKQAKSLFSIEKPNDEFEKTEKNGGRIETRKCSVIQSLGFLDEAEKWPTIRSIIRIESTRQKDGNITEESRYYISSKIDSAMNFNKFIRDHWKIENSFHWVLDVAFNEDHSRKRKDNAGENFALVRRISLNLLKQDKSNRFGIANKRLKAGYDQAYLLKLLGF